MNPPKETFSRKEIYYDSPPSYMWIIMVAVVLDDAEVKLVQDRIDEIHKQFGLELESQQRIKVQFVDLKRYVKWACMKSA
jgi:G:T/U-mismatch repair DNA glycosylase